MKVLKWLLVVVALLGAVFVGGGLLMPSNFHVQRSVEVVAPPERVYALIETPRAWTTWTVWNQRDPAMKVTYSGPESGVGAAWSWNSETQGNGAMAFTAAEPGQLIAYTLTFPDWDSTSSGELRLAPAGNGTRVTWTMDGDMGDSLVGRWMGPFMDRMVGPDFEAGLANLKARAEAG